MGVYIPPDANVTSAINQLTTRVLAAETTYPDSVIILGDFNHTNLKKVLPRYKQHVNCSTRNNNTLDHCYTIFKDAYRATTRAPLGESDRATVVLIPTYRQKLKTIKPTTKTVRKRTADSTITLKACFDNTDWQMFKDSCPDLDAYTDTVTAYISWCEETCYESKLITVYGNDKPWFTRDIKLKLAMTNSAFISVINCLLSLDSQLSSSHASICQGQQLSLQTCYS